MQCDNRILSEQESPGKAGQNDKVREMQKEMDELTGKYQRAANENAELLKQIAKAQEQAKEMEGRYKRLLEESEKEKWAETVKSRASGLRMPAAVH